MKDRPLDTYVPLLVVALALGLVVICIGLLIPNPVPRF